jgi:hypothetical protein
MDREKTARDEFLAVCERHIKDLREALELYQSGNIGTRKGAATDTTRQSIEDVLARLKEWERIKQETK